MISNDDLYLTDYSVEELIDSISTLSVYTIIATQKNLPNEFIYEYVLNSKYQLFEEDKSITIEEIKKFQPNFFN